MLMIFENKEVEVFEWNGKVLFNPKHVAECLDIADVNSSIRAFNEKQVIKLKNSDMHNMQIRKLNNAGEKFLTESGVYKLIFKSKKKEAEKFQDWVTDEVLPQIRQTGGYIPTKEEESDEEFLARALLVAQRTLEKKNKELEEKNKIIEKQKPKVEFYDEVIDSTTVIGMKEVADILNVKGYGRNNLFKFLREQGILNRKNEPYRKYIEQGLFEIKESKFIVNNEVKTRPTPYATQKGLDYIRKILKNKQ